MTALLLLLAAAGATPAAAEVRLELQSVKRIWDEAPHSAFGDLTRFQGRWYAVFREAKTHVARPGRSDDGTLRVIESGDGEAWQSAALIAEAGIDLRDPHFSVTPDGRLMVVAGGSEYPEGDYKGRQTRVTFSRDGRTWSAPQAVGERGDWLWRVTWRQGVAWAIAMREGGDTGSVHLVRSRDGVRWEAVARLEVPGANESTIRFLRDGRMLVLARTWTKRDEMAWIGWSAAPHTEWHWTKQAVHVGGPNFIVLDDGLMVGGGRWKPVPGVQGSRTAIGVMTGEQYVPQLVLPSRGDGSYPGLVWHDGLLWVLYYSSHEGRTAIYLAKVRVLRP